MWTKGHELKYWNKNGLQKGEGIYLKYFDAFDLGQYDFDSKVVVDLGCGPFGGIFSCLKNDNSKLIPMDILAEEYNKMNVCDQEILSCDLNDKISLDDSSCDYVICTNAIDHIDSVSHGFDEIYRILKVGATAFIHVHLRTKEQLNKAHIHQLDKEMLMKYCSKFDTIKMHIGDDWVNDRPDRVAAYMVLEKK
jgi:ubiquinone/menaquinone biosynthesis C-methylase UbiE